MPTQRSDTRRKQILKRSTQRPIRYRRLGITLGVVWLLALAVSQGWVWWEQRHTSQASIPMGIAQASDTLNATYPLVAFESSWVGNESLHSYRLQGQLNWNAQKTKAVMAATVYECPKVGDPRIVKAKEYQWTREIPKKQFAQWLSAIDSGPWESVQGYQEAFTFSDELTPSLTELTQGASVYRQLVYVNAKGYATRLDSTSSLESGMPWNRFVGSTHMVSKNTKVDQLLMNFFQELESEYAVFKSTS